MRQRCQQRGKFRKLFPRRKRTEFCHGFIATHEHETLTTVGNTVDVFCEVTGYFSNRERLCHKIFSMKN